VAHAGARDHWLFGIQRKEKPHPKWDEAVYTETTLETKPWAWSRPSEAAYVLVIGEECQCAAPFRALCISGV